MNCKHCGKPLPSSGYLCSFCGVMMDSEQIECQKKIMKEQNIYPELLSEKYNRKKEIFQSREEKNNSFLVIWLIIGILVIIILLFTFVYFL